MKTIKYLTKLTFTSTTPEHTGLKNRPLVPAFFKTIVSVLVISFCLASIFSSVMYFDNFESRSLKYLNLLSKVLGKKTRDLYRIIVTLWYMILDVEFYKHSCNIDFAVHNKILVIRVSYFEK